MDGDTIFLSDFVLQNVCWANVYIWKNIFIDADITFLNWNFNRKYMKFEANNKMFYFYFYLKCLISYNWVGLSYAQKKVRFFYFIMFFGKAKYNFEQKMLWKILNAMYFN